MKAVFSAYHDNGPLSGDVFFTLEATPTVIARINDLIRVCEHLSLTSAEAVFQWGEWLGTEPADTYVLATPNGFWFRTKDTSEFTVDCESELYTVSLGAAELSEAMQAGSSDTIYFPAPGEDRSELAERYTDFVKRQATASA